MAAAKGADNECIQVVARCRPLNRKENEEKRQNIIFIDSALRQIAIKVPDAAQSGEEMKSFTFDAAYDENTQQKIFYEESCFNIIECALEGFNSTIFAYGQTGCGKSFTMQGPSNAGDDMKGVIPNSFSHIFQFIKASKDVEFLIRCSYLELYNEEIRDLLCNPKNQTKCELKEDAQKGIFVKNLTDVVVETKEDLEAMLDKGLGNRTVASTLMNSESSRSHSIFTIVIEMTSKDKDTGKEMLRAGKLNLVDLAGSERQKKTGAKDATLKEGIKINLSLSALGNVISALSEGGKHIPYRDSKLTRLLQDSLGGNSKTMMIAAISPADYNYDETLSTLRYANRAKNIKNKPKVNEDPKDTIIREFKEEIERLRKLLQEQSVLHSSLNTSNNPSTLPVANIAVSPSNHNHNHVPAPTTGVPLETVEEKNELDYTISSSHNASPLQFKLSELNSPPLTVSETTSAAFTPFPQQEVVVVIQSPSLQQSQSEVVQSPPAHDNVMMEKVKEAHEKLMEKEYEIELERQMREELTLRLQQLQSMLVISNNTSVDRVDSADVGTTASGIGITPSATVESNSFAMSVSTDSEMKTTFSPKELTAEEKKRIQEEEEAQQRYKERRAKAKKQKEMKQQQEMQRILEEKRLMEEELEELRLSSQANSQAAAVSAAPSAAPAKNGSQSSTARGSPSIAQGQYEGNENPSNAMKKASKIKKRYEKKLLAAEEELQEIREDFYYQRKQLLDAVIEQEKDTKLYEQICKAVLNEKDLKKIIDKSRYDEDAEEWIIPYMKRKSFDSLDSSRGGQLYQNSSVTSSSAVASSPVYGSINSSGLLPDINHSSQYNKIEPANTAAGTKGTAATAAVAAAIAAASKSDGTSNTARTGAASRVPILTLPGGLTSASSLATSPLYSHRSEGVAYVAHSDNSGYTGEMPGIGFEKEKRKKSSHGKHKIPKGSGGNSSRMNETQILPANINKAPVSGRRSPAPAPQPYQQIAIDEAGSGIAAGPIDDWGFANENSPSTNGGVTNRGGAAVAAASKNNQESEYSDDEDFEPDESASVPHPPTVGSKPPGSAAGMSNRKLEKKKKKKVKNASGDQLASIYNSQSGDNNVEQTSSNGSTSVRQQQSPRVVMLPPIG